MMRVLRQHAHRTDLVIAVAALAHLFQEPLRVPLRGEQQSAAGNVDQLVISMECVLDGMRQEVEMEVGEKHKEEPAAPPERH